MLGEMCGKRFGDRIDEVIVGGVVGVGFCGAGFLCDVVEGEGCVGLGVEVGRG